MENSELKKPVRLEDTSVLFHAEQEKEGKMRVYFTFISILKFYFNSQIKPWCVIK